MERISNNDYVLLRYSRQRSFGNPSSSPKIQSRTSDVDFQDVFGGPPRRSSIHDIRHSFSGSRTMDSYASRGEEGTVSPPNPWAALSEKPVFGEDGLNRRRYPSDDFFSDIFRGDEPSSSAPRKPHRDPFSSTPSSRVLSPVRPLPPKSDPFGGSLVAAQFSLPARLAKGVDYQASTTPNRSPYKNKDAASNPVDFPSSPSASVSRDLNPVVQGEDDSRNDFRPSYRQSPLSHEFSLSSKVASNSTKCDTHNTIGTGKEDSSGLEVHNSDSQFHFSIYKWASKGIPLVMPLKGGNSSTTKERSKSERGSTSSRRDAIESIANELPAPVLEGVEFPPLNDSISGISRSFQMEYENQAHSSRLNTITLDRLDSLQIAEEMVPSRSESEPVNRLQSNLTEIPGNLISHNAGKEIKPHFCVSDTLADIGLCEGIGEEIAVSMQEARKPELKPLHSLFYDKIDEHGKDKMARQAAANEGEVKNIDTSSGNVDSGKKVKKQDGKRIILNPAEATNIRLQGSHSNSEENFVGNKLKGKVKEFVKIFNQEVPSKTLSNVAIRSQSSRWKDMGACKAEGEASVCATKADGKEQMTSVNKKKTVTDAPIMVDKLLKQSEKPHFGMNTGIHKINDTSSERHDISASSSASVPESFETAVGNMDESHCEDLQGIYLGVNAPASFNLISSSEMVYEQIEELPHDQNKQTETSEEIQILDARIRQWSNGKEGNIRSLLSTLQFVLWPESGWKPVPLVNIIEGNAVKRAYQKALLCLHPDKLQQRGAALHKKYVAQKIFDILQDGWRHGLISIHSVHFDGVMLYDQISAL
ncbi:hypothetical protein HHK36_008486 [Tetracentron sinense]|uniref:J domain-containing protein required for chloroplast accumulation response 1 n=1 Tax=Tetracentron sinense TaxID=13715 RepID=A0A835DNE4_TETSI|nr:hypothetical protein HHK36_008486 [Tetracentron sinense]